MIKLDVQLFEKVLFEINHVFKVLFTLFKCVNAHKLNDNQRKAYDSAIVDNVDMLNNLLKGVDVHEAQENDENRK